MSLMDMSFASRKSRPLPSSQPGTKGAWSGQGSGPHDSSGHVFLTS